MLQEPSFSNYYAIIYMVAWIVPLLVFAQMLFVFNTKRLGGNILAATLLIHGLLLAEVIGDPGTVLWLVSGQRPSTVTVLVIDFLVFGVSSIIMIEKGSSSAFVPKKDFFKSADVDMPNLLTGAILWFAGTTGLAETLSLAANGDDTNSTLLRNLSLICLAISALLSLYIIVLVMGTAIPWIGERVIRLYKSYKANRTQRIHAKLAKITMRGVSQPSDIQPNRPSERPSEDREIW